MGEYWHQGSSSSTPGCLANWPHEAHSLLPGAVLTALDDYISGQFVAA
jgi:hypothetical protein